MKKTAKSIYKNGNADDLTIDNICEIVSNLYNKGLAEAWFIGMEWPEGYHYCKNPAFLRSSFAPTAMKNHFRAVWFACGFLD